MTAKPIHDFYTLLASMSPVLDPREYVFVSLSIPNPAVADSALFTFHEDEGTTYVLERESAEHLGLPYTFSCRRITLKVISALDAVGFLAAIGTSLARHGISANAVSAYHHDHLFVPVDRAEEALRVLTNSV
jgi:hypothetical protein